MYDVRWLFLFITETVKQIIGLIWFKTSLVGLKIIEVDSAQFALWNTYAGKRIWKSLFVVGLFLIRAFSKKGKSL